MVDYSIQPIFSDVVATDQLEFAKETNEVNAGVVSVNWWKKNLGDISASYAVKVIL